MPQVLLYPCKWDDASDWSSWCEEGGRGPPCGGAAGVDVTCRIFSDHHNNSAFPLLKPELGSALTEATQRALDSLDTAKPDFVHEY